VRGAGLPGLVVIGGALALGTGCDAFVSERAFLGVWRIAEHRVELADGETFSALHAGFVDAEAAYVVPVVDDGFPGGPEPGPVPGLQENGVYFLTQDFDPGARAFRAVVDPEPRPVYLPIDQDDLDGLYVTFVYAGAEVPFRFTELQGRAIEARAEDLVWDGVTLDAILVLAQD
jgi:hypothetical protein